MNTVDPIKDRRRIREIKQKLRTTNSRDYLLFTAECSGEQSDRQASWELAKRWTKSVGLISHYGTHSLRKTWGCMTKVVPHKDLPQIMEKLGHLNQEMTEKYIGITQEEINELERKVCIQQVGYKKLETTQIYSYLAPEQMKEVYQKRG